MPLGLKRYQHEGDDHFITFSCYRREPYFTTTASKDTFLDSLELTRKRYNFEVLGYVVMPEQVHLLLSEPLDHEVPLSKALQSLKLSVSKRLTPKPFRQTRYYSLLRPSPKKTSRKAEVQD
jgi:putative transposase